MDYLKNLLKIITTQVVYHHLTEDDLEIPQLDPERMEKVLCEEKPGGGFLVVKPGTKAYKKWFKKEEKKLRSKTLANYYENLYKSTPWFFYTRDLHEIECLLKIRAIVGSFMICRDKCAPSELMQNIFIYYLNEFQEMRRVRIVATNDKKKNRPFYSILGTNEHFECLLDLVEKAKLKKGKYFSNKLTQPFLPIGYEYS
ncbi:hypothetical protein CAEBREN_22642 [Caenorhabditis brenneri]|uniref:Uncharacterized protein n=1 Tax=Caenorhabditis brenneri TaxID=135651 RepID=G0MW83_CAEBE|nr:hypothetical protein CAEBREN_22642 [Caenorhabditis brenneri]